VSPSGPIISFTLPVSHDQHLAGRQVVRRAARLRGLVRLENAALVIEWSGAIEWTEVRGPEVQTRTEAVPATRREIPVGRLADVSVRGWWRPRFELRAVDLEALNGVPSAENGYLSLRIPRAERRVADELVLNLRDEMADAALRAAEGE
jgi:hypothetical protein